MNVHTKLYGMIFLVLHTDFEWWWILIMSFTFSVWRNAAVDRRGVQDIWSRLGESFVMAEKSLIPNTPVLVLGVCWNQSRSETRWRVDITISNLTEASPGLVPSPSPHATIVACSTNSAERYLYDSCGGGLATRLGLSPFVYREPVFDVISTLLLHMCCHLGRQVGMKIIQWGFALRYGGFVELQLQLGQRASKEV